MAFAPVARDRTKTEHTSRVARVLFNSDDGTWCKLELGDGMIAVGNADGTKFLPGVLYRFMGRWKSHDKFGDQFNFETFVADSAAGETGVIAYLTATCDGIGQKTARKLFEKYGGMAVKTLREEPGSVVIDGILTREQAAEASRQLSEERAFEATRVALFGLLKGKGFHGKIQNQCISRWGAKAPEIIRRDPFKLMGMAGAGFKRCDKLWLELGLPPARLKRQLYGSMEAIRNDRQGHTWVTGERAVECCVEAVGRDGARPRDAMRLGVRAGRLKARKDDDGNVFVTLANRWNDERTIADAVKRLCSSGKTSWPAAIPVAEGEVSPTPHQLGELANALRSPVGVFIGGPGSGKTFTLSFLLREITRRWGTSSVVVCAPTGKAAVRATQSLQARGLDLRASTIHQTLEIGRNGHDGAGWGFQRNQDNPLDATFVIVDESSMIDTQLMASLLDACSAGLDIPEQQEQTFQCGDTIPARCLRCHRVLRDERSKEIGYGPECAKLVNPAGYRPVRDEVAGEAVTIPHRPGIHVPGTHVLFIGDPHQLPPVGHGAPLRDIIAAGVPTGELTEIQRNAGRIVRECQAIKAGRPVEWSPTIDLAAGENLRLIDCQQGETAELLFDIMGRGVRGFHPVWDTQVIVALNDKGTCSRTELNGRLQRLLNPDGWTHPKSKFRVGDKVICLRNTWLKQCQPAGLVRATPPRHWNENVYLMGRSVDGLVKIGRSDNPERRLGEIRHAEGNDGIELLHVIKTCESPNLEAQMHAIFRGRWVRGEWFNLDDSTVEQVRRIAAANNVVEFDELENLIANSARSVAQYESLIRQYSGPRDSDLSQDATAYKDLISEDTLVYTANGEIGRIIAVGPDSCVARFGESPTLVRINTKRAAPEEDDRGGHFPAAEADFDLAYAVTCHKLQGSEAPCVIVVADDAASSIATREWWYTAISRGAKLVIVIGPGHVVARQAGKVATVKRKTFLKEAILEAIANG